MSKKTIVLSNNSDGLYGFRNELLCELVKNGDVFVSVPDNGYFDSLRAIGCQVIETPVDRRGVDPVKDIGLFMRYVKILRREKPELVITYTIKPNIYGGAACRLLGIPYASNITGLGTAFQKKGALRLLVTKMYRTALKRARVVFFENAENMQTLLDERAVRREQCCLLDGAGVNLEHYAYAPYPCEETPVRFLFVGRVMREKGVDELLSAMRRLRDGGIDCTLDILGGCEENYTAELDRCAGEGWLIYHGYVKDVRPYIAASHCFVLPSWHEGMANTNLECAAMGRPVITSRIHGCMEAVVDGESGFLCEARNADSLYEAMLRFCHMPRAEREAMGSSGRAHMKEVFDKKKVVGETLGRLYGGY